MSLKFLRCVPSSGTTEDTESPSRSKLKKGVKSSILLLQANFSISCLFRHQKLVTCYLSVYYTYVLNLLQVFFERGKKVEIHFPGETDSLYFVHICCRSVNKEKGAKFHCSASEEIFFYLIKNEAVRKWRQTKKS
jgi:hypothetical protein